MILVASLFLSLVLHSARLEDWVEAQQAVDRSTTD